MHAFENLGCSMPLKIAYIYRLVIGLEIAYASEFIISYTIIHVQHVDALSYKYIRKHITSSFLNLFFI